MKTRIKAQVPRQQGDKIIYETRSAVLTTERPESSYNMPVVVVSGERFARGAAEIGPLQVPGQFVEAAKRAGYTVEGRTIRLHISDLPEDLHAQIKAAAARDKISLRNWVVEALIARLKTEE